MPLTMLRTGIRGVVQEIRGKDETRKFLQNLGFVKGAEIFVVTEIEGNLIIVVKDTRVAVSRAMAGRIMVSAA